jgi:glycerol-3-phosphate dehydrogenase (NAD(P)+)
MLVKEKASAATAKFALFGAGAWGTAVALHLAACGHEVRLVARDPDWAAEAEAARENGDYLPGFRFPDRLHIGADFSAIRWADGAFLACSTAGAVEYCRRIAAAAAAEPPPLITLCKGFVPETWQLPIAVLEEILPNFPCGTLSGPTHARDVALGHPTAAVLAVRGAPDLLKRLQLWISSPNFRIYRTADLRGVELGGSLKNPYAIGMGIAERFAGSGNGQAALFTRMVAELVRIGVALGGRAETFYGLSGLGDLVATGTGSWSRNRTFGQRIAAGEDAKAIIGAERTTVEGYRSAKGFHDICREKGISCPVLDGIYGILYENVPAGAIRNALMARELREESDG